MPATSDEEIKRQHQQALILVDGDGETVKPVPCAPQNELGEISLQDKTQPTYPYAFYDTTRNKSKKTGNGDSTTDSESDSDSNSNSDLTPPLLLLPQPTLRNPICWSTRGFVDVSKLQKMVREGFDIDYRQNAEELPPLSPTNYWDPRNADKDNVTLTRPSHDAWGIGKIVLIFSDDFLTKVYQFPWWKEFEEALQPIIDVLFNDGANNNNNNNKGLMVRALLASLPPGSTIPVHHDTGEWVKNTHRVHVPILVQDPSRVLFQCGPSNDTLQRISCEPGHVFEINNQAKHAVSNCDHVHRVHLILDYIVQDVDDDDDHQSESSPSTRRTLTPIVLEPGEKLVQTRRSVDRLKNMAARPTPTYIILGAQKAGTTSLYHYINEHPWVIKARRRETHCLDWRWNDQLKTQKKQLKYCEKFFFTENMTTRPSCMTGDSTPSYLLDSRRVIPRLKKVFPWSHKDYSDRRMRMKFFVMMRDPVRRAASHYAMVTSTEGTQAQLKTRGSEWREKTLWEVVQMEVKKMKECGLIPYWDTEKGGVLDQDSFDAFAGSPQESEAWNRYMEHHVPLSTGSYGLLTRGMYAVQLRPWLRAFDRDQFLCLKLESMNNGVPETMQKVWAHLDLPNHPVADDSAKNSRQYDPTEPKANDYLQRFFEPHNRVLASVLQQEEEPTNSESEEDWKNPWPYDLLEQQQQ
jgi:hypothetical protein